MVNSIRLTYFCMFSSKLQNARPVDYSDDMEESDMTTGNTLSKKQASGNTNTATKSIMRPSRKTNEEHHKSRAKMLAVANSASKNGKIS